MEPTAKYIDEQNRIAKMAFSLFRDKGFDETSISDIAKAAGIQKGLVQYYFPKKENFIHLFIEQSMQYALESLDTTDIKVKNELDRFYLIGYFESYYLFKHESMNKLRLDILSSRDYSKTIVNCIMEFVTENISNTFADKYKDKISKSFTFAIGGTFEYAYNELTEGHELDIDKVIDSAVSFSASYIGLPKPIKVKMKLSEDWLRKVSTEVDKIMFD